MIRAIAVFMRSPMPARSAVRGWNSGTAPAGRGRCGRHGPRSRSRRLRHQALIEAADAIRAGRIVAVKGLGGFHLMVAAHDDAAVRRLRERKHREEKPFALMFPSLEAVSEVCAVSPLEARLLRSLEAPIVLLKRIDSASRNSRSPIANSQLAIGDRPLAISPAVAPGNPNLGVLLPYTPLHHLLMSLLGFPVVATSGNLSDEPICTDEHEALERLGDIADLFPGPQSSDRPSRGRLDRARHARSRTGAAPGAGLRAAAGEIACSGLRIAE